MHKSNSVSEQGLHCKDSPNTVTCTHLPFSSDDFVSVRFCFNIRSRVGVCSCSSAYQRCGPEFTGKQHFNGCMRNRINTPNEAHMEAGRWPGAKCLCRVCPCFHDGKERREGGTEKDKRKAMHAGRKRGMAPAEERRRER